MRILLYKNILAYSKISHNQNFMEIFGTLDLIPFRKAYFYWPFCMIQVYFLASNYSLFLLSSLNLSHLLPAEPDLCKFPRKSLHYHPPKLSHSDLLRKGCWLSTEVLLYGDKNRNSWSISVYLKYQPFWKDVRG